VRMIMVAFSRELITDATIESETTRTLVGSRSNVLARRLGLMGNMRSLRKLRKIIRHLTVRVKSVGGLLLV
jgi:hypothetical protein